MTKRKLQCQCLQELPVVVTTCMLLVQVQGIPNPNIQKGDGQHVPLSSEDIFTITSFWEWKSQFSLRVWLLISLPHSNKRVSIQ